MNQISNMNLHYEYDLKLYLIYVNVGIMRSGQKSNIFFYISDVETSMTNPVKLICMNIHLVYMVLSFYCRLYVIIHFSVFSVSMYLQFFVIS